MSVHKNRNHESYSWHNRIVEVHKERTDVFKEISEKNRGFILLGLTKKIQEQILRELKDDEITDMINFLDPESATDVLQSLSQHRRKKILDRLSNKIKEKVEYLLKFNPKTAAGMMSLDYVEVRKSITFEDLSKIIRKHEKKTGKIPTVMVIDEGTLIGEVPLHTLALTTKREKISKYTKKVFTIRFDAEEEKVLNSFKMHPHNKLVVLDEKNAVLGILFSDDVLRVIKEKPTKDLFDFAGVNREEDVHDTIMSKVKYRYKWLILNLFTAFMAASVVSIFKETISAFVLLAVYMPIIAGMGGNTGTQTLAVMVRGIALKEIDLQTGKKVIIKEIISGSINGLIIGTIVTIVAALFNQKPLLGIIVGVSMRFNNPTDNEKIREGSSNISSNIHNNSNRPFWFLYIPGTCNFIIIEYHSRENYPS